METVKSVNSAVSNKKLKNFGFSGLRKLFKQSIVLIALFLIWEIAPRIGLVDEAFFPLFSNVLIAWWKMVKSGELAYPFFSEYYSFN